MEMDIIDGQALSIKWVKGELHSTLDAETVDPRGLIDGDASAAPFDRFPWFQRVAKHWQGNCHPIVAHAWHEGDHCWLFLTKLSERETVSLSNWYSFAFRPVVRGQASQILLRALAKRLSAATSISPILTLLPVPRSDGSSDAVMQAFARNGWIALRHQSSMSWTCSTAGKSFEDYWAERPSQLRSTYARKLKKSGIETEVHTLYDPNHWAEYEAVYAESWKPEEGSPAFLRDMAEYKSGLGGYRLGLAKLDGEVIAAQFWIVHAGIAYIHKLAYRSAQRDLSPGTILSAAMAKHVIDVDRVHTIDFGTGDDAYKSDWMDRSDPLDTIRLYKKSSPVAVIAATRARISALVRGQSLD
jgi:hypothetical protein